MDLLTYAEQRLTGVPTSERGCYTKAIWAVARGRWWSHFGEDREPSVDELRAMSNREVLNATSGLGPLGLASLRELLGQ